MVLGELPVLGRPTIWTTVGQGPTALAVGAGGGCLDIFTLIYPFFPLSPSLWETVRYGLTYCPKGPLNPKPTNQPYMRTNHALSLTYYYYFCLFLLDPYNKFSFIFTEAFPPSPKSSLNQLYLIISDGGVYEFCLNA